MMFNENIGLTEFKGMSQECLLHEFVKDKFPSLFQIVGRDSPKFVFQFDHQVGITFYFSRGRYILLLQGDSIFDILLMYS